MADTLLKLVLIVAGVNAMLFLGQAAILDTNPAASQFYNCNAGFLGQFEANGCNTAGSYVLNDTNIINQLPSGETSVSPETGVLFTDPFTAMKTWLLDKTGLGYLMHLASAPYNFLAALELPGAFVFAIGSMWYAFSILVVVAFLIGR